MRTFVRPRPRMPSSPVCALGEAAAYRLARPQSSHLDDTHELVELLIRCGRREVCAIVKSLVVALTARRGRLPHPNRAQILA